MPLPPESPPPRPNDGQPEPENHMMASVGDPSVPLIQGEMEQHSFVDAVATAVAVRLFILWIVWELAGWAIPAAWSAVFG